jgi:hypothetical protein
MTAQALASNVVPLFPGMAVAAPVPQGAERRREPRFACREKLFVQVILCGSQPELVGRTFSARTVDVSASGISFCGAELLPPDALVDLWVDMSNRPGKFFLSGRVRWSRENGEATVVGVELDSGAATDIDAWRALMP